MKQKKKVVKVPVKFEGVDEAIKKAERYVELLKEAKTLADELALVDFEINLH